MLDAATWSMHRVHATRGRQPKQRCREAAALHGARQTFMPLRQQQHPLSHLASSSSFSLLGAADYPVEMDTDALQPRIGMTSCCAKRCAKHKHEGHPAQSAYIRRVTLHVLGNYFRRVSLQVGQASQELRTSYALKLVDPEL